MLNDKSVNLVSHNPHPPSKPVELCLICVADGWSCENEREREGAEKGKLEISSFLSQILLETTQQVCKSGRICVCHFTT